MTETGILTDLDAAPIVETTEGDEAPDAAHIVTQKDLIHSQVTGEAIRALCGKMWVPKRNPDDYPVCQACVDVLNATAGGGA
jgi:hypothetical protein